MLHGAIFCISLAYQNRHHEETPPTPTPAPAQSGYRQRYRTGAHEAQNRVHERMSHTNHLQPMIAAIIALVLLDIGLLAVAKWMDNRYDQ